MKTSISVLTILVLCHSTLALNELGNLAVAREKHPAIFVSGNVLEYSIAGTAGYVFNGEAEQCFTGDMAESDSELYQEAVLDAKNNLRKYLIEHTKVEAFQMSGVRKLYEYPDGKMRRVVLFVAKEAISACPVQTTFTCYVRTNMVENTNGVLTPMPTSVAPGAISSNIVAAASSNATPCVKSPDKRSEETSSRVDRLAIYLKQINDDPNDCVAMSKAAKTYARQGNLADASLLYGRIVKVVLANEKMDKMFAAGLLMEAARFERNNGNIDYALKYYRLFNRCDGLRRWKLHDMVDEANKNISSLLLKAD